ncbi:MAG: thioredoxin domain-containing protein [Chloroflexi bacterium]|nr:thioredoxin domain-containing protein [Chloroflexota bacterium]
MFFTKNKWMIDLVLSLAILFVGFEGGRIYESRTTQSVASVPSAAGGTYDAANCGSGRSADVGVETPWKELPVVTIPDEVVPAWSSRPEDAALVVDVYLDYQCPYSQEYLRTVFPKLVQMAESGELQLVIHDYPLQFHENAMPAAQAARCVAEIGEYQEYILALIADPNLRNIEEAARGIDLDWSSLAACMEEQVEAVMADFEAGEEAGITATPTTVINGRAIAGALPWEVFERLLEEAKDEK